MRVKKEEKRVAGAAKKRRRRVRRATVRLKNPTIALLTSLLEAFQKDWKAAEQEYNEGHIPYAEYVARKGTVAQAYTNQVSHALFMRVASSDNASGVYVPKELGNVVGFKAE
jgi:hypothetical protein